MIGYVPRLPRSRPLQIISQCEVAHSLTGREVIQTPAQDRLL